MKNEIIKSDKNQAPVIQIDFTPEQLHLITSVVAKNASPDELKLFLYRCKILNLDPLKPGKIHFVKYGGGPGTVVVGIEGFRQFARRTGMHAGTKRGITKDAQGKITYGWAEVYRKDWKVCAREDTPFNEYDTGKNNWSTKPETMIKKVAEAAALRMAFSDELEGLGGIYIPEELEKTAEANKYRITPEQPAPGDGVQPQGFLMPAIAGPKLAMKILEEIPKDLLMQWVSAAEKKYEGKAMPPKTKNLYETVVARICKLEEDAKPIELGDEDPDDFDNFKR